MPTQAHPLHNSRCITLNFAQRAEKDYFCTEIISKLHFCCFRWFSKPVLSGLIDQRKWGGGSSRKTARDQEAGQEVWREPQGPNQGERERLLKKDATNNRERQKKHKTENKETECVRKSNIQWRQQERNGKEVEKQQQAEHRGNPIE